MMVLCFCRFIEYGEYKENLYGTSLESIHRILDQNKVCLVDVQPEVSIYTDMQNCQPHQSYKHKGIVCYVEKSEKIVSM